MLLYGRPDRSFMKYRAENGKTCTSIPKIYLIYCPLMVLCCYGFSPVIRFYSTDSAVFYTIGRAMTRGTVVYRDIFDHKGIWIYFFNCAGAIIDKCIPSCGMYLLEVAFQLLELAVLDQIFALFIHNKKARIISVCLFWGLSLNYFTYCGGNLTETYALVFQLISIFFILCYYLSGQIEHPPVYMFVHGFCSGICLFLRMNLTAMWVPFGFALAYRLLRSRKWNCFFRNLAGLLLGISVAALLPMGYCMVNHCMEDMLFCSLFFNISYVNNGETLERFVKGLFFNGASIVFYLSLIGIFLIVKDHKIKKDLRLLFFSSFFFTAIMIFMGMRIYGHYYQTLFPFTLPVFIGIGLLLQKYLQKRTGLGASFAVMILICICLTLSGNLRLAIRCLPISTEYKHLESVLEQTRQKMSLEKEDRSLLSMDKLMQAYVITGKLPETKYPYIPSIDYYSFPEPYDAMIANILSGKFDYIFGKSNSDWHYDILPGGKANRINQYMMNNYSAIIFDEQDYYVLYEKQQDK